MDTQSFYCFVAIMQKDKRTRNERDDTRDVGGKQQQQPQQQIYARFMDEKLFNCKMNINANVNNLKKNYKQLVEKAKKIKEKKKIFEKGYAISHLTAL